MPAPALAPTLGLGLREALRLGAMRARDAERAEAGVPGDPTPAAAAVLGIAAAIGSTAAVKGQQCLNDRSDVNMRASNG